MRLLKYKLSTGEIVDTLTEAKESGKPFSAILVTINKLPCKKRGQNGLLY